MQNKPRFIFFYPLILTYTIWIAWCFVMEAYPELSNKENGVRTLVRISSVLIPALVYTLRTYPHDTLLYLGLKNSKAGLIWGGSASLLLFLLSYFDFFIVNNFDYRVPSGFSIWSNWIIVSPFAEEILFRAVVFQELKKRLTIIQAILLSSLLFVFIHWAPLLILQNVTLLELLKYSINLLLLGAFFSFLFHKSKSLLGSFLPHSINNLISEGVVR